MTFSSAIPVLTIVLTAMFGLLTYLFQKRADRRAELIRLRQQEYKRLIDAFQTTVNENTARSLGDYHKAMLNLFVVASDPVITAFGKLQVYMASTNRDKKSRDMRIAGDLLANALQEMRRDCFEKSSLAPSEVRDLLPIQGVRDSDSAESIEDEDDVDDDVLPENELRATSSSTNDSDQDGVIELSNLLSNTKDLILSNYWELVRVGNRPGSNTANIAFAVFIARSVSALSQSQIAHLRAEGILTI